MSSAVKIHTLPMLRRPPPCGCSAVVHRPLHSPTACEAVRPTSALQQQPLVSWHSFLRARLASVPSAAGHCLVRRARECSTATPDSLDRSDPVRRTAWHSADSAPFPNQEAAMDVQRVWHRDTQQRRSPFCRRAAATSEETDLHSRTEPELQSRSEESV